MVRFTFRRCACFHAVAEQGGIAQAARVLNISQPPVAQAIDKLEAATCAQGVPPEGLAFVPLAELRPMAALARDHPLAGRGSVVLSRNGRMGPA